MADIYDVYNSYIDRAEFYVKDNANVPESIGGLQYALLGEAFYSLASKILPSDVVRLHEEGWIYVYKLRDGSILKPYCGGIDSRPVIERGLQTQTITSSPPKHLDSAVDQLVNALFSFSIERTGAVGIYGLDLNLAPFISRDRLGYREVKQNIQRFVFNLNYPLKTGQSPFTNTIFAFSNRSYRRLPIPNSRFDLYDTVVEESLIVVKAFSEVFSEGDAIGQPFTFPIPTSVVNSEFEKVLSEREDVWDAFWRMVSSTGQMYFLNGFNHNAENLFSFCCRLISDMSRVNGVKMAKGLWDMPPGVGSVNVITINIVRLAFMSLKTDESRAVDKLDELLEVARKALMVFRRQYERLHRLGMYPMSARYIDGENPFKYYYNTIGLIGLAEYASVMSGEPGYWFDGVRVGEVVGLYERLLKHIHMRISEFESEDGVLYNVEEVPGETIGTKLAAKDFTWLRSNGMAGYSVFIPVGEVPGEGKKPFYTNQLTPPYSPIELEKQIEIESSVQPLFTGGVMKHVFVDKPLPPEAISKFVTSVFKTKRIVYMSVTPTISVCTNCGYRSVSRADKCPRCGQTTDLWSRVVGYYRPVRMWNNGRRAEFAVRRDYSEEILKIVGL